MSETLAEVCLGCGRWYLKVAGVIVAMEGDKCRRTDDPAEKLADELFSGTFLGSAKRLVLEMPTDKFDGAGWCKEAVLAAIRRHYPPHRKPISLKAALKLADRIGKPPKRRTKRATVKTRR